MKQGNYLNSIEAANLLGVNVSTIKRWTDSGKLNCIQTAGGHRKFLMKHINEYLKEHSGKANKVVIVPYDTSEHRQLNHLIQKHRISDLKPILLKNAIESHRDNVNLIITGLALAQYPIYKIFDELIAPVLRKIGDLWSGNSICVVEEHIASNILRDAILLLRGIIITEDTISQRAFCFAFSDDQHDIPLKMVQIILEQRGFDVYYSGQRTPIDSIEPFIAKYKPDRVYISSSYYDDDWTNIIIQSKNTELNTIYSLSEKYKFEIYVGGAGFDKLPYDKKFIKRRLNNFTEVYKY